jgi:hypothetical protein
VLERELIRPVVGERRESQDNANALRMGVVDQFAHEVVFDILVVSIVLPRHWELPRSKGACGPEREEIGAVIGHAVDHLLPLRQAERGRAHECGVVAADREWLGGAANVQR